MSRFLRSTSAIGGLLLCSLAASSDPLPPSTTYRPLPTLPLLGGEGHRRGAEAAGDAAPVATSLTSATISPNRPIPGVMMSGGRKAVQGGVRVKLPEGVTWDSLAAMTPDEIRQRDLLPAGLPAVAAREARDRRAGLSRAPDRRDPAPGGARPAALRRRLRSSGPPDAGVPAADLPDHPAASRRRLARPAAHDQELLRAHERHRHAGADGRPAPPADALPAGGVQPDRGPQGRRAEPGRHLPRLPFQLPHATAPST